MCKGILQLSDGACFLVFLPGAGPVTRFYEQGGQTYRI